jgi:hypothetical protein
MRTFLLARPLRAFLFLALALAAARAQDSDAKQKIVVPERVAALVRPILDLRQASVAECGEPGEATRQACLTGTGYKHEQERWRKVAQEVGNLISHKTATADEATTADEALVVLMCYYTGESGDNEDGVINRGRRELPYLLKYRQSDPVIPQRTYPGSMRLAPDAKEESFQIAINAIKKGEKRD